MGVQISVLLFGAAAREFGADRALIEVPRPCTCGATLDALARSDARLEPFARAGRLAVNHAFAGPGRIIEAGDEVALISLVSGG